MNPDTDHFERITVIDTHCVLTDRKRLLEALSAVRTDAPGGPLSVDFTNVHIVAMRAVDPDFRQSTSNVDWFVSDSQILTWAIAWCGGSGHERAYGPEFFDYAIRHGDPEQTHYFPGASQDCLDRLLENLRAIRPDLRVAGARNGYFGPEHEEEILASINEARPDLLWVGLGTPKQQEWIGCHKDRLRVGAALAVGFAFDVNAGTKKDAPRWLGKLGLTWLYRLACEPRRLWKRYLYYNSVFLWKLLRQLVANGNPGHPAGR